MVSLASKSNNPKLAIIIQLARELGLRVHEAVKIERAAAEKALRTGYLTVKGKGGLVRDVPVQPIELSMQYHFKNAH
ncbi:integrase domain-containing protein [Bacillus aerius]|uniref:integrase domain-containing protein n=1 Tax=Bacillus aerius TaxID=293388 RepID=UPI003CC8A0CB